MKSLRNRISIIIIPITGGPGDQLGGPRDATVLYLRRIVGDTTDCRPGEGRVGRAGTAKGGAARALLTGVWCGPGREVPPSGNDSGLVRGRCCGGSTCVQIDTQPCATRVEDTDMDVRPATSVSAGRRSQVRATWRSCAHE